MTNKMHGPETTILHSTKSQLFNNVLFEDKALTGTCS